MRRNVRNFSKSCPKFFPQKFLHCQDFIWNFFPKNFRCVFTFSKYDHQATNKKNLPAHEKRTVRTYAHPGTLLLSARRFEIFIFPFIKKPRRVLEGSRPPLQPLSLTPSTKKFRFPSYLIRYSQREYLNYLTVRYSLFVFSVFKICGHIIAKYPAKCTWQARHATHRTCTLHLHPTFSFARLFVIRHTYYLLLI